MPINRRNVYRCHKRRGTAMGRYADGQRTIGLALNMGDEAYAGRGGYGCLAQSPAVAKAEAQPRLTRVA